MLMLRVKHTSDTKHLHHVCEKENVSEGTQRRISRHVREGAL